MHDSQALDSLTEEGDRAETWLAAGCAGEPCAEFLCAKNIKGYVCEKK